MGQGSREMASRPSLTAGIWLLSGWRLEKPQQQQRGQQRPGHSDQSAPTTRRPRRPSPGSSGCSDSMVSDPNVAVGFHSQLSLTGWCTSLGPLRPLDQATSCDQRLRQARRALFSAHGVGPRSTDGLHVCCLLSSGSLLDRASIAKPVSPQSAPHTRTNSNRHPTDNTVQHPARRYVLARRGVLARSLRPLPGWGRCCRSLNSSRARVEARRWNAHQGRLAWAKPNGGKMGRIGRPWVGGTDSTSGEGVDWLAARRGS